MSVSDWNLRRKERAREKKVKQLEDEQCEYNKIKKSKKMTFPLAPCYNRKRNQRKRREYSDYK